MSEINDAAEPILPLEHRFDVRSAWFECPLCRARSKAAEAVARRLREAGASEQEYLDAKHQPRFQTLREHSALRWERYREEPAA